MTEAHDLPEIDTLWDFSQPAETERRMRALLPQAEQSGDPGYYAELLTQIGRAYSLRSQFDEAHAWLDRVKPLLTADRSRAHIRYRLERGRTYNSAGDKSKALSQFEEAWRLARQAEEDFLAVDAAHMIAIVKTGEEALNWNLKALGLAESSDEERAQQWVGSLYNNIGWTYFDMGQHAQALTIFEKALAWRKAHGQPDAIRIARWCIARVLREMGQVAEALARQQALLREHEAADGRPGYTYEEIGECLLALGRAEEARPYFAQAYEILSQDQWLVANEPERLLRLQTLGQPPR